MRTRRKATPLTAGLVALVLAVGAPPAGAQTAAATAVAYNWRNVEIVGGGFVPGIIYNDTEPGLVYARTDIGGAYRLNSTTGRWVPLLDWLGWDQWSWTGVASMATDPVDPNKVYAAVGTYTNDWDPNNGAILRSTNRGASWAVASLPFKLGGNMSGRSMGERLAIDPNANNILYFGSPKDGLWKSSDYGATWARVSSFTNPGDYIQDPADPWNYLNQPIGAVWTTFDKRTGTLGNPTQTFYVGVADKDGTTIYRTTDAGASFTLVPGQPTQFCCPQHGVLDHVGGQLYITYSNTPGPYDGSQGDVWRHDTATGAWTRISPMPSDDSKGDNYFGYGGLSVDRQNPNTLMVSSFTSWWPDEMIWRSTDRGNTWTRIWDFSRYPNRTFRYTHDISGSPWMDDLGPEPSLPEVNPKLGWMAGDLEIDPFNSNKMMYVGASVYGTDNLTAWDAGQKILITVKAAGIEETSINKLVSPPSGAPLVSAALDVIGFRHDNLDVPPATTFGAPWFASHDLDYAELAPNIMIRVGKYVSEPNQKGPAPRKAAISTNGGSSWSEIAGGGGGSDPGQGGGFTAINANGTRYLWSPEGAGVHYFGGSGPSQWNASSGIPGQAAIASDRVNSNKFYGFKSGTFYRSTNGGQNFTATATGLPANGQIEAVPGLEGHIWLAGQDGGLWRSTDSGTSFVKLASIEEAHNIGFGKAASGQPYMALYTSGKVGGVRGIFRSTDTGATWVRINDDQHQYAWTGRTITGDPRIFGRVYLGTNGRGILYADPA